MSWRRAAIGFAIGLPILALLAFGLTRDPRRLPSTLPGRPAPAFALRTLDGGDSVRLADVGARAVVLNFWASWCVPCRDEHAPLAAAARAYASRGVRFFGVIYNDPPANARAFLDQLGEAYPSLVDDGTRTAIDYGVYGIPETFVIDAQGIVRFKKTGPILSVAELQDVLDPILAEHAGVLPAGSDREPVIDPIER